jgi:hypothetical protein
MRARNFPARELQHSSRPGLQSLGTVALHSTNDGGTGEKSKDAPAQRTNGRANQHAVASAKEEQNERGCEHHRDLAIQSVSSRRAEQKKSKQNEESLNRSSAAAFVRERAHTSAAVRPSVATCLRRRHLLSREGPRHEPYPAARPRQHEVGAPSRARPSQ